jgi:nucleoid-associated protein YgaU
MGADESEPGGKADIASVKDLLDAEDAEAPARAAALADAKELNALAEAEEAGAGSSSSLLPQQAADAKDRKKAAEDAEKRAKSAQQAARAAIPETYVVQEGDTLYKIAIRFYGRTSAWKSIREANKDSIGTDGRVRTGQKLKLPR